ncbi:MAG: cation-translocating P-type ATPase [Candidatus Aenigmarchaeota archaeon]|nr:cation-translocating P-type ATPase [Candidatus Aenigmarchaeota archaeon]
MQWHTVDVNALYKELGSTPSGISSTEASARLARYGANELKQTGGISPVALFVGQFKNVLVITLLAAAALSFIIGEVLDAEAIVLILVINAALGFFQEYKAERALAALRKMVKASCTVLRDGKRTEVATVAVVPGDVMLLEPGDKVPADARLIEVSNLKIQEAALTGESVPVKKSVGTSKGDTPTADQRNMVFMGTDVVYGVGRAIVVATGMATQLGTIASLVQEHKEEMPLEKRMGELSRRLGIASILIVAVVTLIGILKQSVITPDTLRQTFIAGVALAVAAIPEGLPAVVTVSLAAGVQRMARKNSIIRRLPAVETLGSVSVICTDKTGTLTQNKMTVTHVNCENAYSVSGVGYRPEGAFTLDGKATDPTKNDTLMLLLRGAVLCNNAELNERDGWTILGDPTEGCLLTLARKAGMDKAETEKRCQRIVEIPFDSERKMMSTINLVGRTLFVHTKGAPEAVLDRCDRILVKGRVRQITQKDRVRILTETGSMASQALRLLAFAYRDIEKRDEYAPEETERNLVFLGIVGMIDPPRPEIRSSVATAREAGIRTVMVTGDNGLTAQAVAQQIGLETVGTIDGRALDAMTDEQLSERIPSVSVFARVSPQHKVRIVDAIKRSGRVVAMTGDGVNDAPALKKADVGVAMGISGTDVAREASDVILVDDNYTSIVAAVEEGRGVYDNIQKFVNYLLSSNIGEVLAILFSILLFPSLPLTALQLLWINIATDGLPAIALGVDPIDKNIMKRKPVEKNKGILDRNTTVLLGVIGLTIAAGIVTVFSLYMPKGLDYARTMAFTTIVFFEMVNVFNSRTNGSLLREGILGNNYLFLAVLVSVLMQVAIVYTPLATVFHVVPLAATDWLVALAVSLTVFVAAELTKKGLGKTMKA